MVSGVTATILLVIASCFQGKSSLAPESPTHSHKVSFNSLDTLHRLGTLPPHSETRQARTRQHRLGSVCTHLSVHGVDCHRNCVSSTVAFLTSSTRRPLTRLDALPQIVCRLSLSSPLGRKSPQISSSLEVSYPPHNADMERRAVLTLISIRSSPKKWAQSCSSSSAHSEMYWSSGI